MMEKPKVNVNAEELAKVMKAVQEDQKANEI